MRYIVLLFTILVLTTSQLVSAIPAAVLPMAYGGLVSRELKTDRELCFRLRVHKLGLWLTYLSCIGFNRITLAPGFRRRTTLIRADRAPKPKPKAPKRPASVTSPNAPSANGADSVTNVGNGTITNSGGAGSGQAGGTSSSDDVHGRSS